MTECKKEVRRKMHCVHNWLKNNEVILTIYPHGELGFREPRRRAEYRVSLAEAFRQAVVITTNRISLRTKELRKQGMTLGKARKQARKEAL